MIEVDRMPEPDVSADGDAHAAEDHRGAAGEDQLHTHHDDGDLADSATLRRALEEEREHLKSVIGRLSVNSAGADLDKIVSEIVHEHEMMRTTRISGK